jgi:RNA polymerase sigma factor (sigma-70 family)
MLCCQLRSKHFLKLDTPTHLATEHFFRHEHGRLVSTLVAQFGIRRLQLVEDAVQEALVRALQTWPYRGVPDNAAAWLTQTARNVMLDHLRREQRWQEREDSIGTEQERWSGKAVDTPASDELIRDDTLRLMFICCHPQLSPEAQVALALRTLCGFSPAEISAAFLTNEATVSKRLVRARQRIRELELPFEMPEPSELSERLDSVLSTLYLLFNEGYKASSGDNLVREDLCLEAIRLTRILLDHHDCATPRTHALLALMLLNAARLTARTDDAGNLLRLHEQDRNTWDLALIEAGMMHLAASATGENITAFHIEAGIAACHSTAPSAEATDWSRIVSLYDQLLKIAPSPIAALNRAIAVGRASGAMAGMEELNKVRGLESYHLLHAARGNFAAECGDHPTAAAHFRQALEHAVVPSEREFLERQLRQLEDS